MSVSSVTRHLPLYLRLREPARRRVLAAKGVARILELVRASRALVSMWPAFAASGAMTLLISAMMRMMPASMESGFLHGWMEDWLVTWAIGFPLVYVAWQAFAWLMHDQATSSGAQPELNVRHVRRQRRV